MRCMRLAGLLAAFLGAGSARAALPVIDMTSIQHLVQEIQILQQQYSQLQAVYGSLAHPTGVLGMAPELFTPAVRNPLPAGSQLTGILSGNGGGSQLGALINQIEQQNQAYRPSGSDWTAQWINRSAASNAGVQALAETMLQSLQQRQAGLADLQSQLANAQDVTEVSAIGARIQSEQNFVSTQTTEASLLSTLARTQQQAEEQEVIQKQREDADQLFNDTQPIGAGQ